MANLTPTEMVACDQLFRTTLQQLNANISDELNSINNINCSMNFENGRADCSVCRYYDNCNIKNTVQNIMDKVSQLKEEKLTLMKKNSKLQDDIKDYLKNL